MASSAHTSKDIINNHFSLNSNCVWIPNFNAPVTSSYDSVLSVSVVHVTPGIKPGVGDAYSQVLLNIQQTWKNKEQDTIKKHLRRQISTENKQQMNKKLLLQDPKSSCTQNSKTSRTHPDHLLANSTSKSQNRSNDISMSMKFMSQHCQQQEKLTSGRTPVEGWSTNLQQTLKLVRWQTQSQRPRVIQIIPVSLMSDKFSAFSA